MLHIEKLREQNDKRFKGFYLGLTNFKAEFFFMFLEANDE
jgi:hypothetical protein